MNLVFIASGLSVGLTKCHYLDGHHSFGLYLSCFAIGYVATILVAAFAGALSASILGLDMKTEFERVSIIVGVALVVASLMLLIGHLAGDSFDDGSD